MKRTPILSALLLVVACFMGSSCRRGPSDQDRREIARINSVRDTIRMQLDSLARDSSIARESLLGALHLMRSQLLGATDDLLRQRAEALAAGAEFTYQQPAIQPNRSRADSLAREIQSARDSLRATVARASTAGDAPLVAAFARMQVEAERLSIDMMQIARLSALYGIGLPMLNADSAVARVPRR